MPDRGYTDNAENEVHRVSGIIRLPPRAGISPSATETDDIFYLSPPSIRQCLTWPVRYLGRRVAEKKAGITSAVLDDRRDIK